MVFKVLYRGMEVVVDSIDDLDSLAERQAKAASNGHNSTWVAPTPTKPKVITNSIASVVSGLGEDPKRALASLVKHNGQMDALELCAEIGVSDTLSLAGRVLAPIARFANKSGANSKSIIQKVVNINSKTKEKTLEYMIPSRNLDEVKEGLEM